MLRLPRWFWVCGAPNPCHSLTQFAHSLAVHGKVQTTGTVENVQVKFEQVELITLSWDWKESVTVAEHAFSSSRAFPAQTYDIQLPHLDVVAARKPLDRAGPCMCAVLSNSFGLGRHA